MRRITWVFILFLALASMSAIAQQNFASISFGTSIPKGDFASTTDLSNSGYAKTGGVIKFDAAYFPGSYLGIGGSFSFGSNYVERDSLLSDMIGYIEENASSIIDIPEDAEVLMDQDSGTILTCFWVPNFPSGQPRGSILISRYLEV